MANSKFITSIIHGDKYQLEISTVVKKVLKLKNELVFPNRLNNIW
jgi:hypothetical protein